MKLINEISNKIVGEFETSSTPLYPYYFTMRFKEILNEINNEQLNKLYIAKSFLFHVEDSSVLDLYATKNYENIQKYKSLNKSLTAETIAGFTKLNEITNDSVVLESISEFKTKVESTLRDADAIIDKLKMDIKVLENENNIDHLTKTFNKRILTKDLNEILEYGKDKELDLQVLMVDADDFKKVNDKYGHLVGDKVLIFLSKVLKNSVRRGTRVYRFGGEEFIIILNRLDFEHSKEIATRIVEDVAKSKLTFKDGIIQITLSAGLATHRVGDTYDSIIDRADKALYSVKQNGKNSLEVV